MAISQRFAQTPFASGVVGSLPRPLMVKDMLPETPGPESAEAADGEAAEVDELEDDVVDAEFSAADED